MNAQTTVTCIASITGHTTLQLNRSTLLQIDDGIGAEVSATAGRVWITQHRDTRDIELNAGETFIIDRAGPVVISTTGTATLAMRRRETKDRRPARSWLSRAFALRAQMA